MSTVREEIEIELAKARAKFGAFNSAHEGYAVLLEEVDELKAEVFWGPTNAGENQRNEGATKQQLMRAEAIQVAAMAQRFIEDICDRPTQ